MLKSLALIAPALVPSWRFFDRITASPRIEVARMVEADDPATGWREFRPRPQSLSFAALLCRLFWNPAWNETLFLTSCAERLLEKPTAHSVTEIASRICAGLDPRAAEPFFRFRLVLISREGDALQKEIVYVSSPYSVTAG
ncbi:hypothetical protein [Pelagibius sp.]|uniref:hypothetical protein n=1 Tax=Pelagibius sp. TaxID=1931238 RepID=UPI003BAF2B64